MNVRLLTLAVCVLSCVEDPIGLDDAGAIDPDAGAAVDAGEVPDAGETADAGTRPHPCGSFAQPLDCFPSCEGRACGDDGCFGSCGDCGADASCVAGRCESLQPSLVADCGTIVESEPQWAQARGDVRLHARSRFEGPSSPAVAWSRALDWPSAVVVTNDGTRVLSSGGELLAYCPDGRLRWKYSPGDILGGAPAVRPDGSVAIGASVGEGFAGDGAVHVVSPAGVRLFRYPTTEAVGSILAEPDGDLIAAAYECAVRENARGKLHRIRANGSRAWSRSMETHGGPIGLSRIGDAIAVAYRAGQLTLESAVDGERLGGSYGVPEGERAPVVVDSTTMLFDEQSTVALDELLDSDRLQETLVRLPIPSDAWLATDPLVTADGTLVAVVGMSPAPYTFRLAWLNGSQGRFVTLPARVWAAPVLDARGWVFLGDETGTVRAYRPDGTEAWALAIGSAPRNLSIATDGALLVTTQTSVLSLSDP